MLNLRGSNVQVSLFTKDKILIKNVSTRYMYLHGKGHLNHHYQDTSHSPIKCDAPKPGGPLTTRQPAEYKWMSVYPTPLQKIGQSLLCTGSSTQLKRLYETCPKQSNIIQYIQSHE